MAAFSSQLSAFAMQAEAAIDQVMRETINEVAQSVIALSPVDTGRFRSNWYYYLEAPGREYRPEIYTTYQVNNLDTVPKQAARGTHYIVNRTPYGPFLERGSSDQAPQGMLVLTQLAFPDIVMNAARKAGLTVTVAR